MNLITKYVDLGETISGSVFNPTSVKKSKKPLKCPTGRGTVLDRNSYPSGNHTGAQWSGTDGMLCYTGAFSGQNQAVHVPHLQSCVGLIIAERERTNMRFSRTVAYHFGGNRDSWQVGFNTVNGVIVNWNKFGVGNFYGVAAAGTYHPQNERTLTQQLRALGEDLLLTNLVLFWMNDWESGGKVPMSGGYLAAVQLKRNGEMSAELREPK